MKRNSIRGFSNREEDPLWGAGLVMPRAWASGLTTLHAKRRGVAAAVERECSQCSGAVQAQMRPGLLTGLLGFRVSSMEKLEDSGEDASDVVRFRPESGAN